MKKMVIFIMSFCMSFAAQEAVQNETGVNLPDAKWVVPDEKTIPNNMYGDYIKYGKQLVNETYLYIGPKAKETNMRYSGNNLSCSSCHASGGTAINQGGFVGISARFPQYESRPNVVVVIEDRINGCMLRSMNGKTLPYNSKEMRSMVTYMKWLSNGVPTGAMTEGQGLVALSLSNQTPDEKNGEKIYASKCSECHGAKGAGIKNEKGGYMFPPLWGFDSYNTGAGMHNNLKFASYVKANMPKGAATLSDKEALDVATYVNSPSNKRPIFNDKSVIFKNEPKRW